MQYHPALSVLPSASSQVHWRRDQLAAWTNHAIVSALNRARSSTPQDLECQRKANAATPRVVCWMTTKPLHWRIEGREQTQLVCPKCRRLIEGLTLPELPPAFCWRQHYILAWLFYKLPQPAV